MGLFDMFKRKSVQEPTEKPVPQTDVTYYDSVLPNGLLGIVRDIERVGTVKHRDGIVQDLILAKVGQTDMDETIFDDNLPYVGFEIPHGKKITEAILRGVLNSSIKEDASHNQHQIYIGRMQETTQGISFGNKSEAVKGMIKNKIQEIQDTRREENRIIMENREKANALRQQEILEQAKRNAINEEKIRKARIQNPTITEINRINDNGKVLVDYNGTDIVNGDILRLRSVNKVGKDESGTYLYSAYVSKAFHDYDVEMINGDEPGGAFVCFTLPGRLEDMVRNGNKQQISSILTLLSDTRNFNNPNSLTFIGGINSQNEVDTRTTPSYGIMNVIQRMQQNYRLKHQKDNNMMSQTPHRDSYR